MPLIGTGKQSWIMGHRRVGVSAGRRMSPAPCYSRRGPSSSRCSSCFLRECMCCMMYLPTLACTKVLPAKNQRMQGACLISIARGDSGLPVSGEHGTGDLGVSSSVLCSDGGSSHRLPSPACRPLDLRAGKPRHCTTRPPHTCVFTVRPPAVSAASACFVLNGEVKMRRRVSIFSPGLGERSAPRVGCGLRHASNA